MRNLCLAFLCVLAAVVWNGCCKGDTVCAATNTLNGITMATQECEVSYKKVVKDRLLAVATEERDKRTAALAKGACNLDPAGMQPNEACKLIVETAKGHYEGRKANVVLAATRLDAATGLAYAALLTAIDVLIIVRDGAQGKWPELSKLIAEAVKVGQALADAWADLKTKLPTY